MMNDKLLTRINGWKSVLEIAVIIIGIITIILVNPLSGDIGRNEGRLTHIELKELPQIKDQQIDINVQMMQIGTRLEAQTELIKTIADDVEYIRRKFE